MICSDIWISMCFETIDVMKKVSFMMQIVNRSMSFFQMYNFDNDVDMIFCENCFVWIV